MNEYGICPECAASLRVRADGLLPVHRATFGTGGPGRCAGSSRDGAKPRASYAVKVAEDAVRHRAAEVTRGESTRLATIAAIRAAADSSVAEVEQGCTRRSEALRVAQDRLRAARAAFEAL